MKITKIILLFFSALIFATSCDLLSTGDAVITIPEEDDDDKKGPTIITNVKLGYNFSFTNPTGVNLNYKIEDTVLEVGDTLRVNIDSENEVKPYVRLIINEEEVVYMSDLPVNYESIMNEAKEYNLEFSVYDDQNNYLFNSATSVTVE